MTIYLLETHVRWDEDRQPKQAFSTLEKAQKAMKEIYDWFVEQYPDVNHSSLDTRSYIWDDTQKDDFLIARIKITTLVLQ